MQIRCCQRLSPKAWFSKTGTGDTHLQRRGWATTFGNSRPENDQACDSHYSIPAENGWTRDDQELVPKVAGGLVDMVFHQVLGPNKQPLLQVLGPDKTQPPQSAAPCKSSGGVDDDIPASHTSFHIKISANANSFSWTEIPAPIKHSYMMSPDTAQCSPSPFQPSMPP